MNRLVYCFYALILIGGCSDKRSDYIGQPLPGTSAKVFMPGFISLPGPMEYAGVFSPDMNSFYYSHRDSVRSDQRIWYSVKSDTGWTNPGPALFAADAMSYEPVFHPDGKTLYFGSQRSFPGKPDSARLTFFWKIQFNGGQWSSPVAIDSSVGNALPSYISVASDGSIYFGSYMKHGIQRALFRDGCYQPPEPLPPVINDLPGAGHPFIAPDQSYLIFDARVGPDHQGAFDLYISFCSNNDEWTQPINLGAAINTPAAELCASVTPDGKAILFNLSTYTEGDLYWISADLIETLRKKVRSGD